MEIEQVYVAQDGKRFEDVFQCQEYERFLGPQRGTVAAAKNLLSEKSGKYVSGILMVEHHGGCCMHIYSTMDVSSKFKYDLLPVNDTDDNRYVIAKVSDFLRDLDRYDDSDLCELFVVYSDSIDMKDAGCYHTLNNRLWEHIRERNKTCVNL